MQLIVILAAALLITVNHAAYDVYQCDCDPLKSSLALSAASNSLIGYVDVLSDLNATLLNPLRSPSDYVGPFLGSTRGLIIYGPPGTGKTFMIQNMVKWLAALTPPWSAWLVRPSDIKVTAWSGEAVKRFRCVFDCATEFQRVLLVFDEGELLLPNRNRGNVGELDNDLLSEALVQLGRPTPFRTVVMTNKADDIDDAIKRRLGNVFCMRLPTSAERWDLFTSLIQNDVDRSGNRWKYSFSQTDYVAATGSFSMDDIMATISRLLRNKIQRDKVVAPFRKNMNPMSLTDLTTAIQLGGWPTSKNSSLQKYACYSLKQGNPCLQEYLPNPVSLCDSPSLWSLLDDDATNSTYSLDDGEEYYADMLSIALTNITVTSGIAGTPITTLPNNTESKISTTDKLGVAVVVLFGLFLVLQVFKLWWNQKVDRSAPKESDYGAMK